MVLNFLFSRLVTLSSSFTHHKNTQVQLGSLLLQHKHNNAFVFFFNSFSSGTSCSDSESDEDHHKGDTFTVSCPINLCGVSPTLAKKLSKRVNLKNPHRPSTVIDLLYNYGFDKTQVTKLVGKYPFVLVMKAEESLLPKLKFFNSIGVSNTHMPKMLIASPKLFCRSLEKFLIPRYEFLRCVLRDDPEVLRAITSNPYGFAYGTTIDDIAANVEVLRQCGVPQASISYMMIHLGTLAYWNHSKFVEGVNTAMEIGFNPLRSTFILGVQMLLTKSKATWESRFEIYERCGWNHEMALGAFRKYPSFVKLSGELFTKKMNFIVKDMGWSSKDIAEYPQVVAYNFEKRIIPRFSVIKMLKAKGLLKYNVGITSIICVTEKNFVDNFVTRFQKDLPLLPDIYRGVINSSNVM